MLGKLRQAAVLGGRETEKKKRVEEVAKRGLSFTLSLGRWLQENAVRRKAAGRTFGQEAHSFASSALRQ
jgi:hypothetical protein